MAKQQINLRFEAGPPQMRATDELESLFEVPMQVYESAVASVLATAPKYAELATGMARKVLESIRASELNPKWGDESLAMWGAPVPSFTATAETSTLILASFEAELQAVTLEPHVWIVYGMKEQFAFQTPSLKQVLTWVSAGRAGHPLGKEFDDADFQKDDIDTAGAVYYTMTHTKPPRQADRIGAVQRLWANDWSEIFEKYGIWERIAAEVSEGIGPVIQSDLAVAMV